LLELRSQKSRVHSGLEQISRPNADASRDSKRFCERARRNMDLHLVNPDPKYPKAGLVDATTLGYLYVAASVRPPRWLPFVMPSARRARLLERLKRHAQWLRRIDAVVNATVFRAIALPPTGRFSGYLKARAGAIHVADFDVLVLIETRSPADAEPLQQTPAYQALVDSLRECARTVNVIAARNVKRIGDVDTSHQGLFLFNHFAAEDPAVMRQLWDYLAGWYVVETGLDNSVAMAPLEGQRSDYAIVNWARWDGGPLAHFFRQLSKRSFWKYVVGNLEANRAASMPVYCRLA